MSFLDVLAGHPETYEQARPAAIKTACEQFGWPYDDKMTAEHSPIDDTFWIMGDQAGRPYRCFQISGHIWGHLLHEEARRIARATPVLGPRLHAADVVADVRAHPTDLTTEELVTDAVTALEERDEDRSLRRIAEVWVRGNTKTDESERPDA